MKSVLLRLFLALTLTFGFSSIPLTAQDDEKKEEQNENQRGQRGQGGGQRGQGGGQRGQGGQGGGQRAGGLGDMSQMSPEERQAHVQKYINTNIIQMMEASEVREDQQKPFAQAQVKFETEVLKVMMQMQGAGRDRDKRQRLMQNRTKATNDVKKAMKKILDKDQYKLYTAKLDERTPQQRGGRRR